MTNIDTKLMQTYKTAGERRDMIKDGFETGPGGIANHLRLDKVKPDSVGMNDDPFNIVRNAGGDAKIAASQSVLGREIWNAAIEAAAEVVDDCNREGPYQAIVAAPRIRKLKK